METACELYMYLLNIEKYVKVNFERIMEAYTKASPVLIFLFLKLLIKAFLIIYV
jgi:hypothetical protein